MRIAAIIAEYDPFHNGHAWQVRYLKEQAGFDHVLAVMSPDFVQRGEPAIIDMYTRARAALSCGVDAVFALPVCFATGSAEYFATGAVKIIDGLGIADALAFGCEDPDLSLLTRVASVLNEEPAPYQAALKESLSEGKSFPAARETALSAFFSGTQNSASFFAERTVDAKANDPKPSVLHSFLSSPNNILAIEYIRALLREESPITPLPLPRVGSGSDYHAAVLPDMPSDKASVGLPAALHLSSADSMSSAMTDPTFESTLHVFFKEAIDSDKESHAVRFASATAIRRALQEPLYKIYPVPAHSPSALSLCETISPFMPEDSLRLLRDALQAGRTPAPGKLDLLLHYALLRALNPSDLSAYQDMTPDLARRAIHLLPDYTSAAAFADLLHTRNLTHTRVNRALLHVLLGIPASLPERLLTCPYAQLIGFHRDASGLLSQIKKESRIPVITKPSSAKELLTGPALEAFAMDMHAQAVYDLLCAKPGGMTGYRRSPEIL